jgi:hypothetical protein
LRRWSRYECRSALKRDPGRDPLTELILRLNWPRCGKPLMGTPAWYQFPSLIQSRGSESTGSTSTPIQSQEPLPRSGFVQWREAEVSLRRSTIPAKLPSHDCESPRGRHFVRPSSAFRGCSTCPRPFARSKASIHIEKLPSTRRCLPSSRMVLSKQSGGQDRVLLSGVDEQAATQESVPLFSFVARGDPACGDDVYPLSAVAAECRGSALRARDRPLPRDGAALVEPFWADVCSRYSPATGVANAGFPPVAVAPRRGVREDQRRNALSVACGGSRG